jgi:hypothetical protein
VHLSSLRRKLPEGFIRNVRGLADDRAAEGPA